MPNLVDPRHAMPASHDQRHATRAAYRILVGATSARRAMAVRPVHVDRLGAGGLDRELLCWLLFQGHLNHFHEGTRRRGGDPLALTSVVAGPNSWFSLTASGLAFAARLLAPRAGNLIALPMGELTPRYYALPSHRVFSWGVYMLKRFSQRPGNQEVILAAAEEMGWAACFDDPLPRPKGTNSKVRVHVTIADLNRNQLLYLVHFSGHGSGTQIGWRLR